MANAKKLPSGAWSVQVYSHTDANGKRRYERFTGTSKEEVEFKAAEYQIVKKEMSDPANWSLGKAIDEYIKRKEPILSESTLQGYRKIRNNSFQSIMDVPIKKITSSMLQNAVLDELQKKPHHRNAKSMSVKTVKNSYGLVSATLKRFNPLMTYSVEFPRQPRKIRRHLPLPEEVCRAVKGSDIELAVLLAVWLSLSMSEVRGLTKSKSIEGDYLTIREVVIVVNGVDTRKSMAKEVARNRRHRIPPYIKGLIDQVDGDILVPYTPSYLLKHFQSLLKEAGLPQITYHDCRHINATLMASLGIADSIAMERGGWSTDHTMKNVYIEVFSRERKLADDLIDRYFEEHFL